ncbi:hypothetical protein COB80_01420 [Candidatus Kaiserbacteria bacterium]|nr:MAG: hypothetical protein COB80_01420 [Candidatus Kaiserbacteria bacterium]
MNKTFFEGTRLAFGGLSNEDQLLDICPSEFEDSGNPWRKVAEDFRLERQDVDHWKWKTDDDDERLRQLMCFEALAAAVHLSGIDRDILMSWMLSEMLAEIPSSVI